jgi:hypothetical protein
MVLRECAESCTVLIKMQAIEHWHKAHTKLSLIYEVLTTMI